MRFRKRFFLVLTAVLLLVGLTVAVAAAVSQGDIARLKAKAASGEMFTPADVSLAQRINATTTSYIDVEQALARAKQQMMGNPQEPRRPRNPLDDYVTQDTTYSWIDMTNGTSITIGDDENQGPFDLGFTFPFYGQSYSSVRICSNGWISFTSTLNSLGGSCPPNAANPMCAIYGFFTDMYPPGGGTVKYLSNTANGTFVVAWENVPHYYNVGSYTFQIVMRSNGTIILQWTALTDPATCITGIQNADGTQGLSVWCNGAGEEPANNTAIRIVQPDGMPNPVTNLTGSANGTTVTLNWTDPDHDTNGNPLTPDSILIYVGDTQPASQIGHVAHGVQTFTATNQPSGNVTYYARAKAGTWLSAPASVTVPIGNPTFNNNFDSDNGNLIATPATGGWEWGAPTNATGPQPHSSPNVWAVGLTATYANSVCDDLDIDLGLGVLNASAYIEFWAWYYVEPGFDGVNFRASTDGGTTWQIMHSITRHYDVVTYTGTTNCIAGDSAWSGQSNAWVHISIPIGQFVGQTPIFRLKFGSDASVTYTGFFIDDMTIWGLQAPQGAAVSGTVTLDGGAGNMTQVLVTADGLGSPNTHPAANGSYTLTNVQVGNRVIRATLAGYDQDTLHIVLPAGGYTGANMSLRRLPPPAPTNLTSVVLTAQRKDSLHWDVSPDLLVDGYKVYRKLQDATQWTYRRTVTGRTLNWVKDTLEADGVFQFVVTAIDNDVTNPPIESDHSNIVSNPFGHLPPQMLSANSNFDNKNHLMWLAPGVPPEVEASYDDGVNEVQGIGWWGGNPTFGWLVAHYQGTGAVTVTRIKTFITAAATLGAPIEIGVFADAGGGVPTFTPLGVIDDTQQNPLDLFKEWTLTPPITFDNGSFFVGMRQMNTSSICVGGDNTTPFINNTFKYSFDGTAWTPYEPGLPTIPMQRCWVIGNMGGGLTAEYELAPSPVNSMAVSGFSALQSKTVQALQAPVSGKTLALHDGKKMSQEVTVPTLGLARRAFLPSWEAAERLSESVAPRAPTWWAAVSSTRRGHTLDDVVRYLIYRDNVLRDSVAVPTTQYDDILGSTHENQPHSYFVRARWDDNGLSPSTDTLTNVRFNMAPAAPTNVTSTVIGQTQMRITWTDPTTNADGTPCVDLAGIRVYRDSVLISATPVAPGVGQYTDTPPDPQQVYTWTVKAIDEVPNEGPGASTSGSVLSPWHTVTYNWIDISGNGINTGLNSDDQNVGPFDLGFTFPYYGATYTSIRVCSNGFASFNSTLTTFTNAHIPGAGNPTCALYPFWDDLILTSAGQVLYYADAGQQQFILAWLAVPQYSGGPPVTFEIILDASGGITYQYQETAGDVSATIGVENCDHTDAVELCYDGAGLWCPTNGSAVQFWGGPRQAITGVIRHYNGTTNPPLSNAWVWLNGGTDTVRTDNSGSYSLPVDPGTYTVHYGHAQHCDSVRANVVVEANVNTTLNISLRSSAGSVSATSLTFVVHQNLTAQQQFTISNAASGWCSMHFQVVDSVTWLSSSPASGDINPGQSATITVTAAPGNMNPTELHTIMQVIASTPGSPFPINVDMTVLNVTELGGSLPTEFALHQNYPNPFNPTTLLPFDVPQTSQVNIVIYNVMGQEVARPVDGKYSAGRYQVSFNAGNLPSGVYLVKMTAGDFHSLGKMMLLK